MLIPARLAIFSGGVKVDFAFYPLRLLTAALQDPEYLASGYRVLLDKDGRTAGAQPGPDRNTYWQGKHMPAWAPPEIWAALHGAFGRLDRPDSWRALLTSTDLFSRLTRQASQRLGYAFPCEVEENISGFIRRLGEAREA